MYLKRLELLGFKSFAARTVFDFGQGMTAIVGPNGSGKSNIADALRWVLGEHSGSLIRAKKLEEVIYAGSAKRARADKVEVSLVLDNSSGWLPVDTDEVTITRRGSRSGDSDYFLNGRRAKLRDIQTILATASVSQNSYAIIGQGLVESVLNLRAEDRRQLIEEAADIQRYRYKIEEAEQRLKQTVENVERVKLLVKEIAPRMGQLERQARRAGEYAVLSVQLQQALREFYENRWEQAAEALTVAGAAHDQAQAEFLQARVGLEGLQREADEITSRLEETRRSAAAAGAERESLDQKLHEIERSVAVARERRGLLQTRQVELAEELAGVEGERERGATVLSSGDSERKRLDEEVGAARKALQERQAEVSALEAEFRESHMHAADADARAKRLQAVAAEMRVRIRKLKEAGGGLNADVKRHDNHRRSIVHQMTEHLRILQGLRGQDVSLLAEVSGTSTRRTGLEAEVEGLRESLAAVEANQNARLGKLEGLEARLKVLSDAQAQTSADPGEKVTLEGAVATVYQVLRVPRGLEEAIAAVLGEQLEAFVFDRQADAMAAIYAHAREGGPRAAAIPLDSMKQMYPLSLMKEKGVLGVAARLVKYPQKYEKLVNTLLGRVVVVQDIEAAMRLLRRRLGTIVTVDGIIFDPAGFVWGGRQGIAKSFVLAYDRDLEQLPKEMARIRHSIEVTEREAHVLRERLRMASAALTGLSGEADSVIDRRLHLQDTVAGRQQKLAQLRGEISGVMGSITNIREQQKSFETQAMTLEQECAALLEEAKEAADTAKHLGKADSMFTDRRKTLLKSLNEAADALARVDAERRSLGVQEENARAMTARIEAQASAKAVQLRGAGDGAFDAGDDAGRRRQGGRGDPQAAGSPAGHAAGAGGLAPPGGAPGRPPQAGGERAEPHVRGGAADAGDRGRRAQVADRDRQHAPADVRRRAGDGGGRQRQPGEGRRAGRGGAALDDGGKRGQLRRPAPDVRRRDHRPRRARQRDRASARADQGAGAGQHRGAGGLRIAAGAARLSLRPAARPGSGGAGAAAGDPGADEPDAQEVRADVRGGGGELRAQLHHLLRRRPGSAKADRSEAAIDVRSGDRGAAAGQADGQPDAAFGRREVADGGIALVRAAAG